MDDIQIIEDTEKAREIYGLWWGSSELILNDEMISALQNGKCIACNDGEYATFITYGTKEEQQ